MNIQTRGGSISIYPVYAQDPGRPYGVVSIINANDPAASSMSVEWLESQEQQTNELEQCEREIRRGEWL